MHFGIELVLLFLLVPPDPRHCLEQAGEFKSRENFVFYIPGEHNLWIPASVMSLIGTVAVCGHGSAKHCEVVVIAQLSVT